MPIDSAHPEYLDRIADWQMIRDSLDGERAVKARRHVYLPVPPGMSVATTDVLASGKRVSTDRYGFYLSFAEYPELVAPALAGFQGVIHANPPHVELPPRMQYLIDDATIGGERLDVLWERVTRELLSTGRIGLLADPQEDDKWRFATYSAENIINWHLAPQRLGSQPLFVVLREFQQVPKEDDPFELEGRIVYRELRLVEGIYSIQVWETKNTWVPTYSISAGWFGGHAMKATSAQPEIIEKWRQPRFFGRTLSEIPLFVLNVDEMGFGFGPIPLLALARRAMSIYRKSADYNRALYIKGDPQVFISGVTKDQAPTEIGGDSVWTFPNPAAKAQYLDIDGQGIPLMESAIKNEYERFYQEGGKLLDTADRSAESGEALRRRQVASQVSLRSIAQNAGEQMQAALRRLAVLLGQDPSQVVFEADLDFAEPNMAGRELLDIMAAKAQGAPISVRSIHERAQRGGLTRLTFEEEMSEIQGETAVVDGLTIFQPEQPKPNEGPKPTGEAE